MKRKTRRDWGALLTAFDGKHRPPLSRRSAPRTPLAVALARDEAADMPLQPVAWIVALPGRSRRLVTPAMTANDREALRHNEHE